MEHGAGSGERGTTPLLWVVFIMVASTSTLWPILTPHAKRLGAGGLGLGVVVGAIYATRLVLGPWIGRYADRHGYRGLLLVGTLLYLPIALAYAGAGSVATLAAARLLHGVGSAIVLPMVMAVLGTHAGGRAGRAMARYNAAQWLGYAVGPLVGGVLAGAVGDRGVFLLLAPAGIASALAVLLVDRRYTAPASAAPARATERLPLDGPAVALLGYNVVIAPASLVVLSFFPLLAEARAYGSATTGALLAVTSFATAAAQPLWARAADRLGLRGLLLAGGVGAVAGLGLLAGVASLPVATLALLVAGGGVAALVAGTATAAVEVGKRQGLATYVGWFHSAGSFGQAVMPLIYGALLSAIGVGGLLAAVGGLVAVVSVAYVAATASLDRAQTLAASERR